MFFSFYINVECLNTFAHFVWNEEETTNGSTSILKALSVVIETETNDDDEMNEQSDNEPEKHIEEPKQDEEKKGDKEVNEDEEGKGECDDDVGGDADQSETATEEQGNIQTNDTEEHQTESEQNTETTPDNNDESEEKSNKIDETKSSNRTTPITPITIFKKKNQIEIKIPPIWTPSEKRTNAALIYLYFRTVSFSLKQSILSTLIQKIE